jgi:hypothetical protein
MVDLMTGKTTSGVPLAPVFQEVTFEGPTSGIDGTRRRALVTDTHQLIWNWMPDSTTECYDLARDPGATRDIWGTHEGKPVCVDLKQQLQQMVGALALPPDITANVSGPNTAAPEPSVRAPAQIGESLRFRGYDLSAARVAIGGGIDITYHFEVVKPLPAGWKPFFHLSGPGAFYRNLDHVPVNGHYPIDRWKAGQRIRDRQKIVFPPGTPLGPLEITVGLYKGSERLPVTPPERSDGTNRVKVATVIVDSAERSP